MRTTTIYEHVNERILASLERGVAPWRKPWTVYRACNAISGKAYRGINLFLLPHELYSDHRWLTFNQAKSSGGNVRKGEKSSMIVFWSSQRVRKTESETGEPVMVTEQFTVPLLKTYNVFNVEQVDGLTLPSVGTDNIPISDAEKVVSMMPNRPVMRSSDRAAYAPRHDIVYMPGIRQFTTSDAYYATLFHELAHATGHPSRLARFDLECPLAMFGSEEYSKEELVAEFTAAFLCAVCGLTTPTETENHAAYIAGWQRAIQHDSKLLLSAASKAQKAADYIFAAGENATTGNT